MKPEKRKEPVKNEKKLRRKPATGLKKQKNLWMKPPKKFIKATPTKRQTRRWKKQPKVYSGRPENCGENQNGISGRSRKTEVGSRKKEVGSRKTSDLMTSNQ